MIPHDAEADFTIAAASPGDAGDYVAYMNAVGGESDFLAFALNEYPRDEAGVRAMIDELAKQANGLFLLARSNGTLAGALTLEGSQKPRLQHNVELGMTVRKAFWGNGLGGRLLSAALDRAQASGVIRRISLQVRADHGAAIRLYLKQGFQVEGLTRAGICVDGEYHDLLNMGLLPRTGPKVGLQAGSGIASVRTAR